MSVIRKRVIVRDLVLGDGIPKICVPVTARGPAELEKQVEQLRESPCDLVELRADFFDGDPVDALAILRGRLPGMPILFTFRTMEEGGEKEISKEAYAVLNRRAAGSADLIDLEINRGEELLCGLCREIHKTGAKVVASFHDFERTPGRELLTGILCRMQELGADVTKAAVMPRSESDVLTLLEAAVEMKNQYADRPYIVMSMGSLGGISRLSGALTGSAVTFATVGRASAPGQMDAGLVAQVLDALRTESTRE